MLLCIKDEARRENIITSLKTLGFEVLAQRDSQGNIMPDLTCKITIPDDDSQRTAHTCSSIFNLDGVDKVNIFYELQGEKFWSRKNPLLPMVISTVVTLLTITTAIQQLNPHLTGYDYFNLAGIPSIVTFLSQLGFEISKRR